MSRPRLAACPSRAIRPWISPAKVAPTCRQYPAIVSMGSSDASSSVGASCSDTVTSPVQTGPRSTSTERIVTSSSRLAGRDGSMLGIHRECSMGSALTKPPVSDPPVSVSVTSASRRSLAASVAPKTPPGLQTRARSAHRDRTRHPDLRRASSGSPGTSRGPARSPCRPRCRRSVSRSRRRGCTAPRRSIPCTASARGRAAPRTSRCTIASRPR